MRFQRNRLTGVWLAEVDGEWYALLPAGDPDTGDFYCELEPWCDPGGQLEPVDAGALFDETGWSLARIRDRIAHVPATTRD